jgi:biopolymer transport protein ExbB
MQIVERMKSLMMSTGSAWVMWLLIALSMASIAVIVERIIALRTLRVDVSLLRQSLVLGLRQGGFEKARTMLRGHSHPAAKIALRGLEGHETETTPSQAKEAMAAETVAQRRTMEQRFSFLATLGANAPFIGLFGTVVGILQAFDALGKSSTGGVGSLAPQTVMTSISEALVATAIGLAVAIPAVFAFNLLERTVKAALDDADILCFEILSFLESKGSTRASSNAREPTSRSAHSVATRSASAIGQLV